MSTAPPVLEVRGVTKAYGDREVLRGIDLEVGEHRAVALIGASGSGKSTLLRCIDLLEDDRRRRRVPRRRGDHRPVVLGGRRCAGASGWCSRPSTSSRTSPCSQNVVLAPMRSHGVARAEAEAAARELLARFGLAGARGRLPRPPLGRPAAARRDRPRPGHAAARPAARRGHERARPGAGRRGARPGARAEGGGHDDGHRHPRDGLRPRRRRRGLLPPRGSRPGARRPWRASSPSPSSRRPGSSCDGWSRPGASSPSAN